MEIRVLLCVLFVPVSNKSNVNIILSFNFISLYSDSTNDKNTKSTHKSTLISIVVLEPRSGFTKRILMNLNILHNYIDMLIISYIQL